MDTIHVWIGGMGGHSHRRPDLHSCHTTLHRGWSIVFWHLSNVSSSIYLFLRIIEGLETRAASDASVSPVTPSFQYTHTVLFPTPLWKHSLVWMYNKKPNLNEKHSFRRPCVREFAKENSGRKFRLVAGELDGCINPGVQVRKCIEFKCIEVLKCIEQVYWTNLLYFWNILNISSCIISSCIGC
jgi:hypothetical protein